METLNLPTQYPWPLNLCPTAMESYYHEPQEHCQVLLVLAQRCCSTLDPARAMARFLRCRRFRRYLNSPAAPGMWIQKDCHGQSVESPGLGHASAPQREKSPWGGLTKKEFLREESGNHCGIRNHWHQTAIHCPGAGSLALEHSWAKRNVLNVHPDSRH
jgi:hypothetical protein